MYKLFLTLRYLRKRRIAYFAIAAVTLCVAMVLIVMSVMGGWLEMVKTQARGLLGDIVVDNRDYRGFPLYQEFIDEITTWPEVVKATPLVYSYGLIHFKQTGQEGTVRVVGLRLADVYEVNAFKQGLFYERHYPGTTQLGEQQQPLIGFDLDAGPIPIRQADGSVAREYYRPLLPPAYQAALERSRALGISDTSSVESENDRFLKKLGLPPIPGLYAIVDDFGPPRMVGDPRPGLIIGRDIVAKRRSDGKYERFYARGDLVTLTLWATSGHTVDPVPLKQPFRYVDDSRTGIYEIDSQHVYCDFDLLQQLLQMDEAERIDPETEETIGVVPARCSQIQIKIAERVNGQRVDPAALCERLEQTYHGYLADERFQLDLTERRLISRIDAMTWQESQIHIIAPVEKERQLVTILFTVISGVAAMLVLCILYMIVLQKTRDIGIVKSIGGSHGGVALIFLVYGATIGLVGSVLGSIIGCYFVKYINEIQEQLTAINPAWQVWDRSVYSFDEIPNTVRPIEIALVIAAAIIASTLGSLLAALRAGFMHPAEAVRHE